ncbi:hypothetical protein [Listeria immobilis]|uniref:hypothetical protein n=1 Tax=Listeria immobilis TaxID=2713502 RepID=UPI00164E71F1|nr:hypothetical protein [Listeria immobilis]MBC6304238.1 hypothetical protein [Listeria immobilis]
MDPIQEEEKKLKRHAKKTKRSKIFSELGDNILYYGLPLLFIGMIVFLFLSVVNGLIRASDEEIEEIAPHYIQVELGEHYQLKTWEYTNSFFQTEISYIGVNEKTNKRKEVIHEKVTLHEMEETLAKEKTRKKLEKQLDSR